MPALLDIAGRRFGRLVVLTLAPRRRGRIYWRCRCDCGTPIVASRHVLRSGHTISCGCRKTIHGHARRTETSRTYRTWSAMLSRCNNPTHKAYPDYGGRGIGVCKRWLKFETFLSDMGEKPAGLTLERVNNNRGYSPANCKWATQWEQAQNRRNPR